MKTDTCAVCNESVPAGTGGIANSALGAFTLLYCERCLAQGLEPYWTLVGCGIQYEDIAVTLQPIAAATIAFAGKTIEQFDQDVEDVWLGFEKEA